MYTDPGLRMPSALRRSSFVSRVALIRGAWKHKSGQSRRARRRGHLANTALGFLVVLSMLLLPFSNIVPAASVFSSPLSPSSSASGSSADVAQNGAGLAPATSPTVLSTQTAIPTATSSVTSSVTPSTTPTVPPPPTLTPIPDTNYQEQAIDTNRDNLLQEINALPAPAPGITGTLVNISSGGRITSSDGGLTLGLRPNIIPDSGNLFVHVDHRTFQPGDPRATHNYQPLAYTYELTATHEMTGTPIGAFSYDAVLIFNVDTNALAAAGIFGLPRVYTYDEQNSTWVEVLSRWNPQTHQLVATTPHFSLYSVGGGFDQVNNYLPSVNSFETDLQSGTGSVNYPLSIPPGPGGFGPKVTLSYNSGSVDRVDISQQGPSPVGWGWSLSGSYIAATQHHFPDGSGCNGGPQGYHPWTVSIASDGASGDLVKAADGNWHTSIESFARVQYISTSGNWEAWGKDGTHYYFTAQALDWDNYNKSGGLCTGSPVLRPYKWMLTSAVDIHGNTISYTYRYERNDPGNTLEFTPITDNVTKSVYPYIITWGAGGDKIQVYFNIVDRHMGGVFDANQGDSGEHLYQTYMINRIDVNRRQPETGLYALLRSYRLGQNYDIQISMDGGAHTYRHLTLNSITLIGKDNITQLPSTNFTYYSTAGQPWSSIYDQGHLFFANNGYTGAVGYYFDAASSDVSSFYRRVRAKRVLDGINGSPQDTPHNVKYSYDYHGAYTNLTNISAAASLPQPINKSGTQFLGFAWVREQDPLGQVTDHYFTQDDTFKAKEWRTQVGKTTLFNDTMSTPTPTATVTTNANWNVGGTVLANVDPANGTNNVWRLWSGASLQRPSTAYLTDGSDAAMRFHIYGNTNYGNDQDTGFISNWLLTSTTGNNYWGLQVYRRQDPASCNPQHQCLYKNYAKIVWQVNGVAGATDLSPFGTNLPREKRDIWSNTWEWVQLHTAPDGRFVIEQYRDDFTTNPNEGNRRTNLYGDYIMVRAGDNSVPLMPTGLNWTFKHEIVAGDNTLNTMVDDYTETKTVYSEQESFYSEQNNPQNTANPFSSSPLAGTDNNCDGMLIHFIPLIESRNVTYGVGTEAGLYKRTKTTYGYDNLYGNQTATREYGDIDNPTDGLKRTTFTSYTNNTTAWVIGKPKYTRTYATIMASDDETSPNLLAKAVNYYDGHTDPEATPTAGDLTKSTQVGVLGGVIQPSVTSSQQFGYDTYGNQTSVTDPNNNPTTVTTYDTYYHSFPIQVTTANGASQSISYDYTLDVPNTTTDANGQVTHHASDAFGRPASSWADGYGTSSDPNEIYTFPDIGVPSFTTVPFYIRYQVKTAGPPSTYAYGIRWYDGRGRVVQDVTPKDASHTVVVDTIYDVLSQVANRTLPYQGTYSSPPQYATATAQPNVAKQYDGLGRTIRVTNPDGTHIDYDYSHLQWVYSTDEVAAKQHKEQTDIFGRLVQVVDQDISGGGAATMNVSYSYDLLNRLTSVTRDQGGVNQSTSTMEYDALGRKSDMTDSNMGRWDYLYDAAGNLTEQFDALCTRFSGCTDPTHHLYFQYDNMNRVTNKYYGQTHYTSGIPDVKYYYDNALGDASTAHSWNKLRRAEVTLQGQGADKANGHSYLYDMRGLLTSETLTTTLTTRTYASSYAYDVGGRLISTQYPGPEATPESVSIGYNTQGMGLPDSLTANGPSMNPATVNIFPVFSADYNVRGQLTKLVQGTLDTSGDHVTTNFTYDDATTQRGWLTKIYATAGSSDTYILKLDMGYSNNGNITSVSQSNGGDSTNPTFTNTYTYDAFDRLKTASSTCTGCLGGKLFVNEAYQFDSISRMTVRTINGTPNTIAYNATGHVDAPSAYQSSSYAYDANGNQTSRTTGSNTQKRTFDPENRVTQIISDTYTTSYIYDANGARIIKSVINATNTKPGTGPGAGSGTGTGKGSGAAPALPPSGGTQTTLYVGSYEEELAPNLKAKWTSLVNATVSSPSNVLSKSGGNNQAWDAGAVTSQSIASGDGYVSMVADATNSHRIFGLGTSGTLSGVAYGWHLTDSGTLEILEGGSHPLQGDMGSYQVGDVFKVAIEGGTVKYYRNDILKYTSTASPTYPLYMAATMWTPSANVEGALLCSGSTCTSSRTTPPYTTYYTFGAKPVGMRRANYATSGSNGQFRIIGDYLGSTTLIVDTASPPNVVQRQYSKPYGETAWQYTASLSGGASLTNVGYTGQRTDEDSTGLLFYNARMYDPVVSTFMSADTMSADATDPTSRNRFSYVLYNPLRYNDLSGHCTDTPDNPGECQRKMDELRSYGFRVDETCGLFNWGGCLPFELNDLRDMLQAIQDFMDAAHLKTADEFKKLIGITEFTPIELTNHKITGASGQTDMFSGGMGITLDVGELRAAGGSDALKYGFVHELAHAWDARTGLALSNGLHDKAYDSNEFLCGGLLGVLCDSKKDMSQQRAGVVGDPTGYGSINRKEDWAESVASYVYPGKFWMDGPGLLVGDPFNHRDKPTLRNQYVRQKMGLPASCSPAGKC